jgi:uncharacterized protein YceK
MAVDARIISRSSMSSGMTPVRVLPDRLTIWVVATKLYVLTRGCSRYARLTMAASGSETDGYAAQVTEQALTRWASADRGWRATALGALVAAGVLVGVPVPW